MTDHKDTLNLIKKLVSEQPLAALGTLGEEGVYVTLIAFAIDETLRKIFFATSRYTRKFANIIKNPKVSLLIDNRSNQPSDFHQAAAVTAIGEAVELRGKEWEQARSVFLRAHPHLEEFVYSPSCALFQIKIASFVLVHDFQKVEVLRF